MRFIPTNAHGVLDYLVGILLITAPWLFGFYAAGAESLVPIVLGVAVIGYSLFTDYEFGAMRSIPMRTHLWIDTVVGFVLLLSPWLFGFATAIVWPHVAVGLIVLLASLTTQAAPAADRSEARASGRTTTEQ